MPISILSERRDSDRVRSADRRRREVAFRSMLPRRDKSKFGRWLAGVLTQESLKLSDLATELGKEPAEFASYLRRVRSSVVEPRPNQTFRLGEALRCCGVEWCSGAVALFESNYLAEFIDFISALMSAYPREAVALGMALATTRDTLTPLPEISTATLDLIRIDPKAPDLSYQHETLSTHYNQLAFEWAWQRASGSNTAEKNRRDTATDLKLARIVACSDEFNAKEQETRVIDALIRWVEHFDPSFLVEHRAFYVLTAQSRVLADIEYSGLERATYKAKMLGDICKGAGYVAGGPTNDL